MRKKYKNKKRTCGLCKPHKRNGSKRSEGDHPRLKEAERMKEIEEIS